MVLRHTLVPGHLFGQLLRPTVAACACWHAGNRLTFPHSDTCACGNLASAARLLPPLVWSAMARYGLDIVDFVTVGIECTLRQLLESGFFHAGEHLERLHERHICCVGSCACVFLDRVFLASPGCLKQQCRHPRVAPASSREACRCPPCSQGSGRPTPALGYYT